MPAPSKTKRSRPKTSTKPAKKSTEPAKKSTEPAKTLENLVRSVLGKNTTKKKSKSPPKKSVRPGAIYGRTIRRLPIEKSIKTGEDLKAKWDFMMLSGHGVIKTKPFSFVKVPERTYIIFVTPAGCTTQIPENGFDFVDVLTADDENVFYNNILEEIKNPKGLFKTFTNITPAHLYNTTLPPHKFNRENPKLSESQLSRAIYTPNTKMPEMIFNFNNREDDKWVLLGLYKLPIIISKKELKSVSTIYRLYSTMRKFDIDYFTTINKPFHNLLKDNIRNNEPLLLSDLFKTLPSVPEDKTRLLIIQTCRGVMGSCPIITEQVRRYSLGLRSPSKENKTS